MANFILETHEREMLERMLRLRRLSAAMARRASVVLALADGNTYAQIIERFGCSPTYIAFWQKRFASDRLGGMVSRHVGQPPRVLTPALEETILDATRRPPPDGSAHWSTRKLGKHLNLSHMMIARVWVKHGLTAHQADRYRRSAAPNIDLQEADVIGLYVRPPAHAAVFRVDPTAPHHLSTVLQVSPRRGICRVAHAVGRGTLQLFDALEAASLPMIDSAGARHSSGDFVGFLTDLVWAQPRHHEIHVIVDNTSAQKTKLINDLLGADPNVRLHFTTTYSAWLRRVELWFFTLENQLGAHGVFKPVDDLAGQIMHYIRRLETSSELMKWRPFDGG